jgi:hypothetical protein
MMSAPEATTMDRQEAIASACPEDRIDRVTCRRATRLGKTARREQLAYRNLVLAATLTTQIG